MVADLGSKPTVFVARPVMISCEFLCRSVEEQRNFALTQLQPQYFLVSHESWRCAMIHLNREILHLSVSVAVVGQPRSFDDFKLRREIVENSCHLILILVEGQLVGNGK